MKLRILNCLEVSEERAHGSLVVDCLVCRNAAGGCAGSAQAQTATRPLLGRWRSAAQDNAAAFAARLPIPPALSFLELPSLILNGQGKVAGKDHLRRGRILFGSRTCPWQPTASGLQRRDSRLIAFPASLVTAGQMKSLNPALQIEVEQQQVEVQAENTTISTAADANASAIVIKGRGSERALRRSR